MENDPFAWWTDRHDNTHIYWTGDGQEVYKGCQCGLKVRKKYLNLSKKLHEHGAKFRVRVRSKKEFFKLASACIVPNQTFSSI